MNVRPGDRIRLIEMGDDPLPVEAGTEGVVGQVGPAFEGRTQVSVVWDSDRSLCLVVPPDRFEVVGHEAVPEPYASIYGDQAEGRVWTCQHGTERRGYATPTANCRECRAADCVWTEQQR